MAQRLRGRAEYYYYASPFTRELEAAADLIERQAARIAELEEKLRLALIPAVADVVLRPTRAELQAEVERLSCQRQVLE